MKWLLFLVLAVPSALAAQDRHTVPTAWTGIGAIGTAAMFMDTATIVRDGALRKVWLKSVDTHAQRMIVGADTVTFDTVVSLNSFDCATHVYSIQSVHYYDGDETVLSLQSDKGPPEPLHPRTFMRAIADDLCRDYHAR